MNKYHFFLKGELSQWIKSPFKDHLTCYQNAEQYMMAWKAAIFEDQEALVKIMSTSSPKEAKQYGRNVKNFNQAGWDANKINIVFKGNFLKFSQNEKLADILIATEGKILVEANPYDRVWGIGYDEEHALQNIDKWGENLLGNVLMEVRKVLLL